MRFLADECVAAALVVRLRDAGHDVRYIAEDDKGSDDRSVIRLAVDDGRILLTEDKDFGDFAFRQTTYPPGIVFLRIDPTRRDLRVSRVLAAIARFGERLSGRYTVVEESRFRSRPLLRATR